MHTLSPSGAPFDRAALTSSSKHSSRLEDMELSAFNRFMHRFASYVARRSPPSSMVVITRHAACGLEKLVPDFFMAMAFHERWSALPGLVAFRLREAVTGDFQGPPTEDWTGGRFMEMFPIEVTRRRHGYKFYWAEDVGEEEWGEVWAEGEYELE